MSHIQDSPWSFFSFGSPFRMISPTTSYLSPELLDLLNSFEETLSSRLKKLHPTVVEEEILSLSWLRRAMESLSAIHIDIKALIAALELPVCDWDEKWIGVYLDNSIKLLDICIAFSSEISRLKQGYLFLLCVLHDFKKNTSHQNRIISTINKWRQHITAKNPNPRMDNCYAAMNTLSDMLQLPKSKKSSKCEVLMHAMYGVAVVTLFIFRVFASAFSGSAKELMDLQVSETYLWAETFTHLQTLVTRETRKRISSRKFTILEEIENADKALSKLHEGTGFIEGEEIQKLENLLAKSSQEIDFLKKDVDDFFQVILTGRDALLCNLRGEDDDLPEPNV